VKWHQILSMPKFIYDEANTRISQLRALALRADLFS